jgi:hypothetical protein
MAYAQQAAASSSPSSPVLQQHTAAALSDMDGSVNTLKE